MELYTNDIILFLGYLSVFILGLIISWKIVKSKYETITNAIENEANIKLTSLQNQLEIQRTHSFSELQNKEESFKELFAEKNIRIDQMKEEYSKLTIDYKYLQSKQILDKGLISELQTKLDEQSNAMKDKLELLQNNEENLKNEFKNLATNILDSNSKKFASQNKESMDLILNPMKQQIHEFKKKVEDVYMHDVKDRSELKNELKSLKELNQQISTDAVNLTSALKGQSKQQGIWGEMVLEKVLENSGLRKDEEYVREKSLKNDDGKSYRPDVIVNLPDDRHIIIDSKTSLTAYEQYVNEDDESAKKVFLDNHLISINRHINELSDKKYEELKGINTLDFIFLFVPIESALMLATQHDKELFEKAFKKKIVLVSPTTLLVALKAIESSWRYEKQAKNVGEIYDRTLKLYEKIEGFVSTLETVGKHIKTADEKYEKAFSQLSTGSGNVLRQVELLKNVSQIKPKKVLSEELLENSI